MLNPIIGYWKENIARYLLALRVTNSSWILKPHMVQVPPEIVLEHKARGKL